MTRWQLAGPGDLNWQRIVPQTIRHVIQANSHSSRSDSKFIRIISLS